jgi:diketogulonate reductase-like aldo/keto reductase
MIQLPENGRLLKLTTAAGIRVSALGQGTTGAGRKHDATSASIKLRETVLRLGIETGMSFLDTGENYEDGHAEEIVGRVIKEIRNDVFVSSKFIPLHNSYGNVMKACEGSLKRLGTDYIDLYQIQWPNPAVPLEETVEALMQLLDTKKIRYAGVCNFTPSQLKQAQVLSENRISTVQVEYSLSNRFIEKELMPVCSDNGVTLIAYSPFAQGRQLFNSEQISLLKRVSSKYQATPHQIIISWLLTPSDTAVIVKSMSAKNTVDNAKAVCILLESVDINSIDELFVQNICLIPTRRIRLRHSKTPEPTWIFNSLEEAIENKLNLHPGPIELAKDIQENGMLKPVEVIPTTDRSDRYDYDLIHGQVRYWAWIIAHGNKQPIPANIIQGKILQGNR